MFQQWNLFQPRLFAVNQRDFSTEEIETTASDGFATAGKKYIFQKNKYSINDASGHTHSQVELLVILLYCFVILKMQLTAQYTFFFA